MMFSPFSSKRLITRPISRRCTQSGLSRTKVRSMKRNSFGRLAFRQPADCVVGLESGELYGRMPTALNRACQPRRRETDGPAHGKLCQQLAREERNSGQQVATPSARFWLAKAGSRREDTARGCRLGMPSSSCEPAGFRSGWRLGEHARHRSERRAFTDARRWPKRLATHAIFFLVNDSDSWSYLLANPDGEVSEFDSDAGRGR